MAGLVPQPHDERRTIERRRREQAQPPHPLDPARVPHAVGPARQRAERDPLRHQRTALAERHRVADGVQVARDLAGEHLEVAGAEHPRRRARVAHRVEPHRCVALVDCGARRLNVAAIEGDEVEALREHEHVGHEVAAATDRPERLVVAPGTRVRVGPRDAVERAQARQRLRRIRQFLAGALHQRTSAALLLGPVRREQATPVFHQFRQADAELLVVFEMARNRHLAADLRLPH